MTGFGQKANIAVRFREDGEFSDLVLRHAAASFKVHRIIVCPQSKVLHKACSGGFKVW